MIRDKTKIKIAGLIITGLAILVSIPGGCTRQTEDLTFPDISGEFEIQGLMWRTIAYYYHPGIYREMYNPESNLRLISKAKNAGANYLLIRAFYNCDEDGSLIGNDSLVPHGTILADDVVVANGYHLEPDSRINPATTVG